MRIRLPWAFFALVLGAGGGVLYVALAPAQYQATAQVFVVGASPNPSQSGTISQQIRSYAQVVDVPAVTGPVISQLGLKKSEQRLAREITADVDPGTLIIDIHVLDRSASTSATICNAVAAKFVAYVESLKPATPASGGAQLMIARPATTPSRAALPRKVLDVILSAVLGLLLGVIVVGLRALMDRSVRTADELKELVNVPLLGAIPRDKKAVAQPLAFRTDSHGGRAEGYRQLRANLQFIQVDSPPRIIAVTSALPAEGKSLTAINLAAALAESGRRVCLIEADLRRPTIARTLGLIGDVGLTTVLTGNASLRDVMQNAGKNLVVMASGAVPPNPSEILLSQQFRSLVATISSQVDFVVLDTAPLLVVADGAEIASIAEVILLVVRSRKTRRDQITRAVETLQSASKRPVGTVLNQVRLAQDEQQGYAFRPGVSSPPAAAATAQEIRRRRGQVVGETSGASKST